MTRFWTQKTEQAALLVAEDRLTDDAIAAAVGRSRETLEAWKRRPDFQERRQAHIAAFAAAIRGRGIAERQNRVAALNDRWDRMRQVIEDRAAAHGGLFGVSEEQEMGPAAVSGAAGAAGPGPTEDGAAPAADESVRAESAPGAGTGLLVRQERVSGTGKQAVRTVEWQVDTGLLNELRQHEKQAAQELGQWTERAELTGKGGAPLQIAATLEVRAVDYRQAVQPLLSGISDGDDGGDDDDAAIALRRRDGDGNGGSGGGG